MVFRLELPYTGNLLILDMKYIDATTMRYTLEQGSYEVSDMNFKLKSLLPIDVKVNITIEYIRLRSNLTNINTMRFTKNSVFYTILGFTRNLSGPLSDIEKFDQLIPGTYKSDKPIKNTGVDKVHIKCDCINESSVNGAKVQILYSNVLKRPRMTSNGLAKPDKGTESTVIRASKKRNKSTSKGGSMHENVEINNEHLDEFFHIENLHMELARQIIFNGQTVGRNTVQDLKECNSQFLATQFGKPEELVSMMPTPEKFPIFRNMLKI